MNEILDFFLQHWQLSCIFILVVGAYVVFEYMLSANSEDITPEQAVAMINHEQGVVIDVRTATEFSSGHILHAVNIDANEPDIKFKKLNKYANKPVIVVCATGRRSAACVKRMQDQGYERVYNLSGGIVAWQNAGLPLVEQGEKK